MNRLVKYLGVILKWRRLIFWNTLTLTLVAIGVSFILPPRYAATAQLLPPSDEGDVFGLGGLVSGASGGRLGRLRAGLTGAQTGSEMMIGILGSRTVMQQVAERCSLARFYAIRKPSPEKLVRQLKGMTKLGASDEGIVSVTVEAKTRELAAGLANAYVEEIDSFLRHSNISRGRNMRVFIERRLVQIDSSLAVARESLQAFQEANRVASVDVETRSAIEAYAKLRAQLTAQEAEYEALRTAVNDDNPALVSLRRQTQASREGLRRMEQGGTAGGFGVGFGVTFFSLPGVAAQFARLYQDYKIQEEAYAALYQQYEYARVLEARDAPALTVLDYAVPPERRSFPRRKVIVGVVFIFSLAAGVAFAFVAEYADILRSNRPDEYRAWVQLLAALRRTDARTPPRPEDRGITDAS